MDLEPGWLARQFAEVNRDIATWPEWMRRAIRGNMDAKEIAEVIIAGGDGTAHSYIDLFRNAKAVSTAYLRLRAENEALKERSEKAERHRDALSESFSMAVVGLAQMEEELLEAKKDVKRINIIANNAGSVISELLNGNDEDEEFPEGFRVEMILNGRACAAEAVELRDALDELISDAARKENKCLTRG